jgi:hypothetical protein
MYLPILDRLLIPLDRQTLYSLVAPAHAGQQTPDPTGHITHLEQLPDHMPDPVQGPVVFRIPVSVGAFQQLAFQFLDLRFGQVRFFSRSALTLFPRVFGFLSPATDAALRGSQLFGNFLYRFSALQQGHCFLASFRKLFRCARWSHAPIILQIAHPGHFYVKTQ